jgi:hypothetical protein
VIGRKLIALCGGTLVASLVVALAPGIAVAVDQSTKNGCTSPQAYSGAITSPPFTTGSIPALSFQAWFEIEGVAPTSFDVTALEYSTDGVQWDPLGTLNEADPSVGFGGDAPDQPVSNMGPRIAPNWESYDQSNFPLLSDLPNQTLQIRFRFATNDSTYQGFRGVALDNVSLETLPTVGFEQGLPAGWTIQDLDGVSGPNVPEWQVLTNPQTVSVKSPEINPDLVTLPDAGFLPPAFAGSGVAWWGDTATGAFCGPDYANRFQFPPPPPPQPPRTLADLPNPVQGSSVNVQQLAGTVTVGVPGTAARGSARASQKGVTFVPLSEARQIPVGSFLDTRRGKIRLQSARDRRGTRQNGDFSQGLFQVFQSRKASARGMTELRLKGASFRSCRRAGRGKRARAAASIRRRLRSSARGRFRTRARHSAGTVRGTAWLTADRCDGTLTKVTRGKVAVRDFRRRKTVLVRAGKSYLARAPR